MTWFRTQAGLLAPLRAKPDFGGGSRCAKCYRKVRKEHIVEEFRRDDKHGVLVKAECHGDVQTQFFDLGTAQWDYDDVTKALRSMVWFKDNLVPK